MALFEALGSEMGGKLDPKFTKHKILYRERSATMFKTRVAAERAVKRTLEFSHKYWYHNSVWPKSCRELEVIKVEVGT